LNNGALGANFVVIELQQRAVIENSRHVMLVVDHSKFGRNAMVNMGSISMVDAVYTDAPPPVSVMQVLTGQMRVTTALVLPACWQ
ncbi:hypothetical protein ACUOFC_61695, partial [Escherichia sp. TWPC-MK]